MGDSRILRKGRRGGSSRSNSPLRAARAHELDKCEIGGLRFPRAPIVTAVVAASKRHRTWVDVDEDGVLLRFDDDVPPVACEILAAPSPPEPCQPCSPEETSEHM